MSEPTPRPAQGVARQIVLYGAMLVAAVALFRLACHFGERLPPPVEEVGAGATAASTGGHGLEHVLLALAAVILLGRILGWLFRFLHQPPVIAEVVAGILLGPSLLGAVAPQASAFLLPPDAAPLLAVIADLGIVLYMFIVGLELDTRLLRERAGMLATVSLASMVTPFVVGGWLALPLYRTLGGGQASFSVFAMFLGVAMSVTAFPVLARILSDQRLSQTRLGVIALGCAAAGDVVAWCLLALVLGLARADVADAALGTGLTLLYIAGMFLVARPILARVVPRIERNGIGQGTLALVFLGLLLSALTTQMLGVHAVFGAFLLGAVIPHDSALARDLSRKLEDLVTALLLPAFFAYTGMRTQIGLVAGAEQWLMCGLIIVAATLGKFGGTFFAGRASGLGGRDSAALGALMNTRGLMELIVLNIGLEQGVLSRPLFAMLVLMALVTTMMTTPALRLLGIGRCEVNR